VLVKKAGWEKKKKAGLELEKREGRLGPPGENNRKEKFKI
jgi:hypothetical protein